MDSETTKQIPDISILKQDIVRVELHTKDLKGLSYRDLELASIIDSFDFEKYKIMPLEKEKGYKSIIRKMKLDEQNKSIEEEIASMAGGSRFGNKFKSSEFEAAFGNK